MKKQYAKELAKELKECKTVTEFTIKADGHFVTLHKPLQGEVNQDEIILQHINGIDIELISKVIDGRKSTKYPDIWVQGDYLELTYC